MKFTAPHDNPFRAAMECARANGIKRKKVAKALLSCTIYEDWSPEQPGGLDDMLACIAERTNIVVQRTEHGTFHAYFNDL